MIWPRSFVVALALPITLGSFACSEDAGSAAASGGGGDGTGGVSAPGGGGAGGGELPTTFGGDRPVTLAVPDDYDPAVPAPLVILLHGYGASGAAQNVYFGLGAEVTARGGLFAAPDGTVDQGDRRFWNATDACCNFYGSTVDDSAYLRGLVDAIGESYSVDPKRVHFVGHSNGGFMSYRMACDHAAVVASIVSLAGATFLDAADCAPSEPVHVLQIHGTDDDTIAYDGGETLPMLTYPGAVATVEQWATVGGCGLTPDTSAPALDLESGIAGAESTVSRYAAGCQPGGSAELWTIAGGGHIPSLSEGFAPAVVDFLFAHPKP
ncbi:MAG: alpha/beta hydrolase-fold protein [Polyangiaceae bacterium]